MGRVTKTRHNPKVTKQLSNPSIEEHLRIFANLIIDRILEDQRYGVAIKKGV